MLRLGSLVGGSLLRRTAAIIQHSHYFFASNSNLTQNSQCLYLSWLTLSTKAPLLSLSRRRDSGWILTKLWLMSKLTKSLLKLRVQRQVLLRSFMSMLEITWKSGNLSSKSIQMPLNLLLLGQHKHNHQNSKLTSLLLHHPANLQKLLPHHLKSPRRLPRQVSLHLWQVERE